MGEDTRKSGRLVSKGKHKDGSTVWWLQAVKPDGSLGNAQPVKPEHIDSALDTSAEEGLEVEFSPGPSGQPIKITAKGAAWQGPARPVTVTRNQGQDVRRGPPRRGARHEGRRTHGQVPSGRPQQDRYKTKPDETPAGFFHNPYNFIPAPPRQTEGPLGDHDPSDRGHAVYHEDHYSGRVTVKMTTKTPLVIIDPNTCEEGMREHKIYGIRKGPNGEPMVPATALRGMIRSAYEAVTNSRMGVFAGHDQRLTYRSRSTLKRELFEMSPLDLVKNDNESLLPARTLSELSSADRLFGWVQQNGEGAFKGLLRVSDGALKESATNGTLADFGKDGLPLAILGEPKPAQARFYLSENPSSRTPNPNWTSEAGSGYRPGQSIRGRKVYPHHRGLPDGYWDPRNAVAAARFDERANGRYREYLRSAMNQPREPNRDSQNRSITEWVQPDCIFEFDLDFTNLNDQELGALLWLLDLNVHERPTDGEFHHRLGFGKPLGLGSVVLSVRAMHLWRGQDRKRSYRAFKPRGPGKSKEEAKHCVEAFRGEVGRKYGKDSFLKLPFIRAFLNGARGIGDESTPVHYPRLLTEGEAPGPKAENFRWFVRNEQGKDFRYALPDLAAESDVEPLPLLRPKARR